MSHIEYIRNGRNIIYLLFAVSISFITGCNGSNNSSQNGMSEIEQLKYDNTLNKLNQILGRASNLSQFDSEEELYAIREEINSINYDFNVEMMDTVAQKKCLALKKRIQNIKNNPDSILNISISSYKIRDNKTKLVSRQRIKVEDVTRYPFYFNNDDVIYLNFDSQGDINISLYDINRHKCIKIWKARDILYDSISIPSKGIYMIELKPIMTDVMADYAISYKGTNDTRRPKVREIIVSCNKNDFLAMPIDSLIVSPVFKEPKKIGLRGALKAVFSGKTRGLITLAVPDKCNNLLYYLRISNNEVSVSSDGKFADNLLLESKKVKLLGVNLYEKQKLTGNYIDRLLFNTRPPREEDAYCNMYVFTNSSEAKRFQDETSTDGNYKYDVEQSQIGTQSCNGELNPKGLKYIYVGFENERMRYDNYIWFDAVALSHKTAYKRPKYELTY